MAELSLTEKAARLELSEYHLERLRKDEEFLLYRGQPRRQTDARLPSVLVVAPVAEHPAPTSLRRMEHEYALRAELNSERTILVLEDQGGKPQPLEQFAEEPFRGCLIASLLHQEIQHVPVLIHRPPPIHSKNVRKYRLRWAHGI